MGVMDERSNRCAADLTRLDSVLLYSTYLCTASHPPKRLRIFAFGFLDRLAMLDAHGASLVVHKYPPTNG